MNGWESPLNPRRCLPLDAGRTDSLPQRVVLGKEKSRNESGSNASSTSQQDHDQYAASHADKSREVFPGFLNYLFFNF